MIFGGMMCEATWVIVFHGVVVVVDSQIVILARGPKPGTCRAGRKGR